jgi:hypothetical protein
MGPGVYLLRARARLAIVVSASTVTITASEAPVEISGIDSCWRWAKWNTSLNPMNVRIAASPVDRYTSRSSRPATRKNSGRMPSSANTFVASTRYGFVVTP